MTIDLTSTAETVAAWMKSRRAEKRASALLNGINILNAAVGNGGWVPGSRGSSKVKSALYAGLVGRIDQGIENQIGYAMYRCLKWGSPVRGVVDVPGIPSEVVLAWADLCSAAWEEIQRLDALRPKPVISPIGLSPRVTATLKECGLDIDMTSITFPEIEPVYGMRDGVRIVIGYRVVWPKGTKFRQTRFCEGHQHCEACGKYIPSGDFVPLLMTDKANGLIGTWVGRDCAKKIFGVKDIGMKRI